MQRKCENRKKKRDEERIFRDISLLEHYSLTDGEKARGKVCMPTKKKKKILCRTWNILFQAISCNFQRKYISICFSLAMCFPLQNHPYRIIDQKHIPSSFFALCCFFSLLLIKTLIYWRKPAFTSPAGFPCQKQFQKNSKHFRKTTTQPYMAYILLHRNWSGTL